MRVGIITVEGRGEYLNALTQVLRPEVDDIKIFTDTGINNHTGHFYNLKRCMTEMLDGAKKDEPILITTDDVITVPGWRKYWEKIHSRAQNNIYVLMARQHHLFTPGNISRGYITKCQLRGYYDHATIFINQNGLMDKVLTWFNSVGKNTKPLLKRGKWLDVIIQEYLIYHKMPWTITIPTLFNHIGTVSTLGNNIGGSPDYIGDCVENL